MIMMNEIKILEIRRDDKIIELTNEHLRVREGPFIDRTRRIGIPRERWFAREEYQLTLENEIPINKIVTVNYERGKFRILWMKREGERFEKPEEYEIKLMAYEAELIMEVLNRLKKGEDPIILAKEYSQTFIGYREEIPEADIIVSIEGDYVKIESGEMNRIISYRYIVPYVASLFGRLSEIYAERIPINEISNVEMEVYVKSSGENEYHVKIALKNGKIKDINFHKWKDKAETFTNTLNKILTSLKKYRDKEERIRYEIQYKPLYEEEGVKRITSNLKSIAAPTLMIFLILATLASQYIGRDLETMILVLILSIVLGAIWKKIRG
jgi:hypothetical protein